MTARETAARHAAQAITVGILKDACDRMLASDAFMGRGVGQARKVSRWCRAVLDGQPGLTSSRGLRNLRSVCELSEREFARHWPDLPADSGMSACARIFAALAVMDELRRRFGLASAPWRYLTQTTATLVAMILANIPEEEERMWSAAVPVMDAVLEVAA